MITWHSSFANVKLILTDLHSICVSFNHIHYHMNTPVAPVIKWQLEEGQNLRKQQDWQKKNQSKYIKEKPQFVKHTGNILIKLPWRNLWINIYSHSVNRNLTWLFSNNITFFRFQLRSKKACHSHTKCCGSWGSCPAHLWLHWSLLFCCQTE